MYKKYLRKQKGIGVAITLLAIMIISILGMALLIRSTSLAGVITQKNYTITATEAAKAGISHAINRVEADLYYTTPISYTPLSTYTVTNYGERGYYKVNLLNNLEGTVPLTSPYSGYIVPPGVIEVVSTGYAGNPAVNDQKRTMRIVAMGNRQDVQFNPWSNALTLGGTIIPGDSAGGNEILTDSYSSSAVPPRYSGGTDGDIAILNLDQTVNLGSRNIQGEIKVPEGASVTGTGTYLDASGVQHNLNDPNQYFTPMTDSFVMTSVMPKTPGTTDVKTNATLSPGAYRDMFLESNRTITLEPGTYIFRDIINTGGGSCRGRVNLKLNGPVKIFVTGNITMSGNVNVNSIQEADGTVHPDQPASYLKIFGTDTCNSVSIGGSVCFCGGVYAPNATFTFNGLGGNNEKVKSDLWGSFAGNNAIFSGAKVSIHYDEMLNDGNIETFYTGIAKGNMRWVYGY